MAVSFAPGAVMGGSRRFRWGTHLEILKRKNGARNENYDFSKGYENGASQGVKFPDGFD